MRDTVRASEDQRNFPWQQFAPEDSEEVVWDAVIVGAGMGGSTLGFSLAQAGFKVLFVERGNHPTRFPRSMQEGRLRRLISREPPEARLRALGRWSKKVTILNNGKGFDFFAPMGAGPGGSSAIYGGGLERMRRVDFAASNVGVELGDAAPLSDGWPLDFDEFRRHYERAEALFRVVGTNDPSDTDDDAKLVPPPPLTRRDQDFFESFKALGMKPYRVHVGFAYEPSCHECIGIACPTDCKADGSSRALRPALRDCGAKILLNCEVERLESDGARVTSVVAKIDRQTVKLRGRVVVLAAGALCTPNVLRNSTSPEWPTGIGNQNDLVGRCLMFHASDLVALWPRKRLSGAGPQKTISSRVFYEAEGKKLGSLQSLGLPIAHGLIFDFLATWIERNIPFKMPMSSVFVKGISVISATIFRQGVVFATIIEDFPYRRNRVVTDDSKPSGYYIDYEKPRELSARITLLRNLLKKALAPHKPWILTGDDNMNMGHPSGTCRMGTNPETSVVDPENRVHGVENLYVVDASFFPSSGGTNPALTVAANALRVADIIKTRLR
jgi:choline dehydrogenase-like flavoprotein